jgi:hypothetical protein
MIAVVVNVLDDLVAREKHFLVSRCHFGVKTSVGTNHLIGIINNLIFSQRIKRFISHSILIRK